MITVPNISRLKTADAKAEVLQSKVEDLTVELAALRRLHGTVVAEKELLLVRPPHRVGKAEEKLPLFCPPHIFNHRNLS